MKLILSEGHEEAGGYVASLFQLASWCEQGLESDADEMRAAAHFISHQAADLETLRGQLASARKALEDVAASQHNSENPYEIARAYLRGSK